MGAALVPLQNITLGSAAASVSFGSIPSTFRDLRIVIQGGATSGAENLRMTVNSDTTYGNYSWVRMSGNGSSASSSTTPGDDGYGGSRRINTQGYFAADLNNLTIVDILDYSATDKHKVYLSRANQPGVDAMAIRWASTAAITGLSFDLAAGATLRTGTIIALYGVKA